MRFLRNTIVLVLLVPLLGLVLWLGSAFLYETWNTYVHSFRLTLEVDTPDGVKSDSSVIRVAFTDKATWALQTPGALGRARGEAVFVDLGRGKNVIVTLAFGPLVGDPDHLTNLAALALRRDDPFWFEEAPNWDATVELDGENIPGLATFADLADPRTARVVNPQNFEEAFGPGYRFRTLSLEMTHDAATEKIKMKLPWVDDYSSVVAAWRALKGTRTTGPAGTPDMIFKR
ncbi:MAG: hypothetical protein AB7F76_12660 [Parvibaculaceae bacterium]